MTGDFLTVGIDDPQARAALERLARWLDSAPDAARALALDILDALCAVSQGVEDVTVDAPREDADPRVRETRERIARAIAPAAWDGRRSSEYARARRNDSLCAAERVLAVIVDMGLEHVAEDVRAERMSMAAAEPREDSNRHERPHV